ncbi:MAG: hypothetical protein KF851_01550 [Pirellulaceae bacterium]|nr:hypothetical protein [Pirellulaceae bacterium]
MISKGSLIEPPRWGIINRWPNEPDDWIHPDDIETARELLPSIRVFRREVHSSDYLRLHYGRKSFRAKPTLWLEVGRPPFDVGDYLRVSGLFGIEYPLLGTVSEVIWNPRRSHFEFQLRTSAGGKLTKLYRAQELERVTKLDNRLTQLRPFGQSQNLPQKLIGI